MKKVQYVIKDELGIHARPAGLLVKEAKKFESKVMISCGGKEADCKKMMALMGMGVKQGQEITLSIEGADEDAAAQALEAYLKANV